MILNFFDELAGYANHSVWIGKIKQGLVVQDTDFDGRGSKVLANRYGHIVAFARNPQNELTLVVRWDTGETYTAHPGNIKLLDI